MSGLTIELINDYFIEVDELNHTLKKRYMGKDKKTGEKKPAEKIIGYYKNVQDCLERIVRLIPLDENDGAVISCVSMPNRLKKPLKRLRNGEKRIMARLTNSIDYCATHCDFGKRGVCFFKDKSKCYEKSMFDELKAYEEVVDSPEKLKLIDELYLERCEEINRLRAELAEYKRLEEDGLLIRLNVSEGIIVYLIDYKFGCKHNYECPLSYDEYKCEEHVRCEHEYKEYRVREAFFNISMKNNIGKNVFLTRKEAEQALERMKEVQDK